MKKVIVLGGGAAGMTFAAQLVKFSKDYSVHVFEKTDRVAWAGCPTPYWISGHTVDDECLGTNGEVFKKRGIEVSINTNIVRINFQNKEVITSNNELHKYDILLLSMGAKSCIPNVEGLSADIENYFTLSHAVDAIKIKSFTDNLDKGSNVTIVGAGFIGLEMSETFNELGYNVTLVQNTNDILYQGIPEIVSKELEQYIEDKGITLLKNTTLTRVHSKNNKISSVVLENNKTVNTDLLFTATGVKPNLEIISDSSIIDNGFVTVNDKFETSLPDVYALGDLIKVKNYLTSKKVYAPLGDVADKQAIFLAKTLAGKNLSYKGVNNSFASSFYDKKIAHTGLTLQSALKLGYNAASTQVTGVTKTSSFSPRGFGNMELVYSKDDYKILGASMIGNEAVAQFIDQVSLVIFNNMTLDDLLQVDYAYSPTNASVWNPLLAAYRRVMKGNL